MGHRIDEARDLEVRYRVEVSVARRVPMTIDFVTVAATALAGTKLKIVGAEAFVPNTAGLYAIYGDAATWHQLGLGEPPDARPLYIGKAEVSLRNRDLKQHFKSGKTGSSTVRRAFAAMLRDVLGFRGLPRSKLKPDKPSHFGLDDEHEAALTAWMNERLRLAVWAKPAECGDLHAVEVAVLARFVPPLNQQDNPTSPWLMQVRNARRVMADDARAWAAAHFFTS